MNLDILKNIACTSSVQSFNTNLPCVNSSNDQLSLIINIVIGIIAALSVLFIVIGGFRLILSAGNPQDAARARSTIVYALIGLIIALLAEAIVAFVLKGLSSNG